MNDERSKLFRTAVGRFATGVCVIASHTERGPTGLTVNAFASLSLDPLLVIVCFDKSSRTLAAARESGRLSVNVLGAGQVDVATRFATKGSEEEKFTGVEWSERAGVPVLGGVVAWFAGPLRELLPGGDHLIGVVEVEEFESHAGEPLVYCDGQFAGLLHTGSVKYLVSDEQLIAPLDESWDASAE